MNDSLGQVHGLEVQSTLSVDEMVVVVGGGLEAPVVLGVVGVGRRLYNGGGFRRAPAFDPNGHAALLVENVETTRGQFGTLSRHLFDGFFKSESLFGEITSRKCGPNGFSFGGTTVGDFENQEVVGPSFHFVVSVGLKGKAPFL